MQNFDLKDFTLNWMGRTDQYRTGSRGTFWPSEASVKFKREDGSEKVAGKCLRATWFRLRGVTATNPPNAKSQVIFLLGKQIENTLVEVWKQAGIWDNNSVKFEDRTRNISGEFDCIVRNPNNNTKFGVECVTPDTLIPQWNDKITNASEVNPGDILKDYNYRPVKVLNKQIKPVIDEKVYSFKTRADGLPVKFSGEHPIWTAKIKIHRNIADKKKRTYEITQEGWTKAQNINPGDWISIPILKLGKNIKYIDTWSFLTDQDNYIVDKELVKYWKNDNRIHPIPRFIKADTNFFRLMGFYLSEGCRSGHNVTFSFHEKEQSYRNEAQKYLKDYFGLESTIRDHGDNKCKSVLVTSKLFADFIEGFLDKGAHNKRIRYPINEFSKDQALAILGGWIDGDGTIVRQKEFKEFQTRGYTVSPHLAYQMFQLALACGFAPRLKKFKQGNTSFNSCGYVYRVEWSSLIKPKNRIIKDNKYYIQVRKVITESFTGNLINYEVDGSNTFTAGTIGTHNCKSFWGYFQEKHIMGHSEGRGKTKHWVYGKPKDENLLQTAIYCDNTRETLDGFKLFYISRDNCDMAEFSINVEDNGTIKVHDPKQDAVIPERRFKINDIYNRFAELKTFVDNEDMPPCDFNSKPSDEEVERLYNIGEISKSAYEGHIEGKEKYKDFHCGWCDYRDHCFAIQGI